jgi:hypothetical protein
MRMLSQQNEHPTGAATIANGMAATYCRLAMESIQ